jgi:K+-sensing histidine kinase KdpD
METTLEKINRAALKILIPLSANEMYKTIVDEAIKLVNGDDGSILLEDHPGSRNLVRVYSSSEDIANVPTRKRGFTYTSFIERRAYVTYSNDFKKVHPETAKSGVKSVIFIPLSYKNQSIGVLLVRTHKVDATFTNKELNILKLFGSMASLGIKKTQLYEEVTRALEVRDHFISLASHELRTPLTAVNGYIQLLHSRLTGQDTQEGRWTQQLLFESTRLTNLVTELLAINQIKTGKLHYEWKECNLINVLERVLNNFYFNHPARKVIFKNSLGKKTDVVVGDFDKLIQAFTNILDNAAKFSPADSEIQLTISYKSSNINICVKDCGTGISESEVNQAIHGFYKGTEFAHGMGLGIFLVNDIIKRHKGTLKIKSKKGYGSEVNIKLPEVKY